MVKVKVCGITNLEDALSAAGQGADALGFVFYKKSPRYIKPIKARAIIKQLPKSIKRVGVFVNAREGTIRRLANYLRLDMLQFHGFESGDFCSRFKGFKIIKAFRVSRKIQPKDLSKYNVWAYLFDTSITNKFGGTGKSFDWQLLSGLSGFKKIIFLSGGLNPGNVRKALEAFPAQWVDASSSLERYAGKKDAYKIRKFIRNAKAKG
ncbi:MAG: phosphoribosylanthranilate isomerase [Candidatus Omnitrophota bacterium]|jgi:phosphoribosylanthranilate isomerase